MKRGLIIKQTFMSAEINKRNVPTWHPHILECCPEITPISDQPLQSEFPEIPPVQVCITLHRGQSAGLSFGGEPPGPTRGPAGLWAVGEQRGDTARDRKHLEEATLGAEQGGGIHHLPAEQSPWPVLCCPPRASNLSGTSFIRR